MNTKGHAWAWPAVALWTAGIYFAIPFAVRIRACIEQIGARNFFLWSVWLALGAAAGYAVYRLVRGAHGAKSRLAWIVLAGGIFIWKTWALRAHPEEAFHFLEYGVLGGLVFWALSARVRDPLIYPLTVLLVAVLGTVDELIQWLTPGRYFDARDIGFNALASALVLVGIAGGFRPAFVQWPIRTSSVRCFCGLATVQTLLAAFCLFNTPAWVKAYSARIPALAYLQNRENGTSEYGYRYFDPETGVFQSRFTLEELKAMDAARAREAAHVLDRYHDPRKYGEFLRTYTPITDPFLHELRVHLYRRDHFLHLISKTPKEDQIVPYLNLVAYRENRIAEKYFPQSLSRSKYVLKTNAVAVLKERMDSESVYVSEVSANLITSFTRARAEGILAGVMLLIVLIYFKWGRSP